MRDGPSQQITQQSMLEEKTQGRGVEQPSQSHSSERQNEVHRTPKPGPPRYPGGRGASRLAFRPGSGQGIMRPRPAAPAQHPALPTIPQSHPGPCRVPRPSPGCPRAWTRKAAKGQPGSGLKTPPALASSQERRPWACGSLGMQNGQAGLSKFALPLGEAEFEFLSPLAFLTQSPLRETMNNSEQPSWGVLCQRAGKWPVWARTRLMSAASPTAVTADAPDLPRLQATLQGAGPRSFTHSPTH